MGPGAHGFDGVKRYSLISNNNTYIREVGRGCLPEQSEVLSALDRSNEMLMTGLRTSKGVDFKGLKNQWGIDHISENRGAWEKWLEAGAIVTSEQGCHRIAEEFWLVGDSISADLISIQS